MMSVPAGSVTVQTGCFHSSLYRRQIIHLHKKNIVGPTERSKMRKHFLARKAGPTFFDEDDVCAGNLHSGEACLHYYLGLTGKN